MPYNMLKVPSYASDLVRTTVQNYIDLRLWDLRFLLGVRRPDQGARGSLQWPLVTLTLVCVDGAAQLLQPGREAAGHRFKAFLLTNYPWDKDPPAGIRKEQAVEILWHHFRCALIHRMSLRKNHLTVSGSPLLTKLGVMFDQTEESLDALELRPDRPYSEPTMSVGNGRIVLWAESLYWALRRTIERSLDTPEKCSAIDQHLQNGDFDTGRGLADLGDPGPA